MTADRRRSTDAASTTAAPDITARADAWEGPAPRMRDVGHDHGDHDPRAWHWFARGPLLAADGGEPADEEDPERTGRNVENERLRDVSHVPAHGEGANQVWERGENEDDADE